MQQNAFARHACGPAMIGLQHESKKDWNRKMIDRPMVFSSQ
jgi:hypothetical protein